MTDLIPASLPNDVRQMIDMARTRAAAAVNSELTLLYWQVGRRIRDGACCAVHAPLTGSTSSLRLPSD
ncbi:DUF1016 family protein [Burkholderia sp. Bp9031]|nr:DUF1016 family protein [Burkholderia sp. Bp9031]